MTHTITILGSTGSIGRQTLSVAEELGLRVAALTAEKNVDLLEVQCRKYRPELAVMTENAAAEELKTRLADMNIRVLAGSEALCEAAALPQADTVVAAVCGFAALRPTLTAIRENKRIALANKETMVCAGQLMQAAARASGAEIIPVDSEHSAIFQCLAGENDNAIEKIILTASGGPFRTLSAEELKHVTKNEALKHPNWKMGAKITIDSASMMNKGFEVIEAQWLFNVTPDQIEVAVHPQSIVHSMVQFQDGAIKAQLGLPNMKLPIQYAFAYPHRLPSSDPKPRLEHYMSLTFERPDTDRFPLLGYAYEAMRQGGNMPCIMNAANEIVVEAFLHDRIAFTDMPRLIARAMDEVAFVATPTYDDYVTTDAEARRRTREWI